MDINSDNCHVAQSFGGNATALYVNTGLKGHPGEDLHCGYGTPVHSPYDGYVYKVLTKDNPSRDGSGFTGVFMIVDNGLECFEFLIGHCDPGVSVGDNVLQGQVIGTEANHGTVFDGGLQITLAMQKAGDKRGSHRHMQKRPVLKVSQTQPGFMYLDCYSDNPAGVIYRDGDRHYYQIWNYGNGYHGCIDPAQSVFSRSLTIASTGYDVYVLQNILVREGVGTFAPTGYFGNLTRDAVERFQMKRGIFSPIAGGAGVVGPRTITLLQHLYQI